MDVGTLNAWDPASVVSASEILERIHAELPLEAVSRTRSSDVANRYRYKDDGVELGVISSITAPFCGDCSRARLTSDGGLYTCLFGSESTDIKGPLRSGASDDELSALLRVRWARRSDRYSEVRAEALTKGARLSRSPQGRDVPDRRIAHLPIRFRRTVSR